MDNPETLATLGTQDTGRRLKQNTKTQHRELKSYKYILFNISKQNEIAHKLIKHYLSREPTLIQNQLKMSVLDLVMNCPQYINTCLLSQIIFTI